MIEKGKADHLLFKIYLTPIVPINDCRCCLYLSLAAAGSANGRQRFVLVGALSCVYKTSPSPCRPAGLQHRTSCPSQTISQLRRSQLNHATKSRPWMSVCTISMMKNVPFSKNILGYRTTRSSRRTFFKCRSRPIRFAVKNLRKADHGNSYNIHHVSGSSLPLYPLLPFRKVRPEKRQGRDAVEIRYSQGSRSLVWPHIRICSR